MLSTVHGTATNSKLGSFIVPELPEAETIVRGLKASILHRTIQSIEFPPARYFRPQLERSLETYLGSGIVDVFRHGKSVILQLRSPAQTTHFIVVRLGMTGQLLIGADIDRHTHAIFSLDGPASQLSFRDQRQFGRMFFVSDWRPIFYTAKLKAKIADNKLPSDSVSGRADLVALQPVPDPLSLTAEAFAQRLKGRRGMIKAVLMSQQVLVGVGNIYADESLFAARIHPRQNIERLSQKRLREYFRVLTRVLDSAIALGGSTISDFVNASNTQGEFQIEHKAYGRTGERCKRRGCRGVIKRIVVASRSTHFCPHCQRRL